MEQRPGRDPKPVEPASPRRAWTAAPRRVSPFGTRRMLAAALPGRGLCAAKATGQTQRQCARSLRRVAETEPPRLPRSIVQPHWVFLSQPAGARTTAWGRDREASRVLVRSRQTAPGRLRDHDERKDGFAENDAHANGSGLPAVVQRPAPIDGTRDWPSRSKPGLKQIPPLPLPTAARFAPPPAVARGWLSRIV